MSNTTTLKAAANNGTMPTGWIGLAVVLTVVGAIMASSILSQGHMAFNTSSTLPWGLPIVGYMFFGMSAVGLVLVASMATVFGVKAFQPIVKRSLWLAFALLIAAFITLALELGHPFRMLWVVPLNLQIASPMFWMGLFYALFFVFLALKLMQLNKNDWTSSTSRRTSILLFVSVILSYITIGLVFGMMTMRPYWFGGFNSVYFLFAASLSGVAFSMLFAHLAGLSSTASRDLVEKWLPNLFAFLLFIVLLFTLTKMVTGLWTNNQEVNLVAQHIYGSIGFHLELWVGMVLPLILMISPGLRSQAGVQMVSAILVLIAIFIARYEYVIGGQLVPLFKGTWHPDLLSYSPSSAEIGTVLIGAGIGLFVYAVGNWKYRLNETN